MCPHADGSSVPSKGPGGTRTVLALAALLAVPALAGCIGLDDASVGGSDGTGPGPGAAVTFRDPVAVSRDQPGAEPVVDVARDGTLFLQGIGTERRGATGLEGPANNVWRSTDDGATWEDVTPPLESGLGADSFVFVGPEDTVYVANDVLGSHLSIWRSLDLGDSWVRALHVPLPGPVHRMWLDSDPSGRVHVVVFSLPPGAIAGVAGVGAGEDHVGAWHTRSDDRGRTWSPATQISPAMEFGTDLEVGPDGTLHIISLEAGAEAQWDRQDQGRWRLYRSTDAGESWGVVDLWSVETVLETSFQSLTIDEAGTLYFHWAERRNGTARILHAVSSDGGDRWTEPATLLEIGRAHV